MLLPSSVIYATYLTWRVRHDNQQQQLLANATMPNITHDILSNLPVHSFHREKDIPSDECIICLEEYQEGEKIRTLPCKHLFHSTCIQSWLNRKQFVS